MVNEIRRTASSVLRFLVNSKIRGAPALLIENIVETAVDAHTFATEEREYDDIAKD